MYSLGGKGFSAQPIDFVEERGSSATTYNAELEGSSPDGLGRNRWFGPIICIVTKGRGSGQPKERKEGTVMPSTGDKHVHRPGYGHIRGLTR